MKKPLAMLLILAMLLSACACAEGVRLSLTDMKVYENGTMSMDITGFCAEVAAATIGESDSGMRLYCSAEDQGVINFTIGETNGKGIIGYGAGDGFDTSYQFPSKMQLHDQILEFDLIGAGDWSFVDALRSAIPEDCQTDGGNSPFNGENCAVTNFEMSEAYMDTVIQNFARTANISERIQQQLQAAGFDNLLDAVRASNMHLSLSGGLYKSANVDALDMNATLTVQQIPLDIQISVEHAPVAEGHVFDLYAQAGILNETIAASARLEAVMDGDVDWLPLDASNAEEIDPQSLDPQEFSAEIKGALTDLLSVAGNGATRMMLKNQLAAAQ